MYPAKQKFLILGLSRSGKAAAEFLLQRNAEVYIYDDIQSERIDKTATELVAAGAKLVEKEKILNTAEYCDALVLSPGIPIDHALAVAFRRRKKCVLGETELAARYMRANIVAVTGTNGKTTTVSLINETLLAGGYTANACGNVGTPMLNYIDMQETEIAVAEISSFQLETLNSLRPHIAVVLNITEDHLNRHYNMENYIFLKAKLLKNLTETEYAVLNYDDITIRSFAERTKAKIIWFSLRESVEGAYLDKDGNLTYNGEKILKASELSIGGEHNIQNALAAIAVASLMGVAPDKIALALKAFKGIRHRVERIEEIDGVSYINDSKGTNVDATVKAVACMKSDTVLLLGGKDKGYDYEPLFQTLKNSLVKHAVLYGENGRKLYDAARKCGYDSVTLVGGFEIAVRVAAMIAKQGQTVLLSPASASFDEFAGYEERGEAFVQIVRSLKPIAPNQELSE